MKIKLKHLLAVFALCLFSTTSIAQQQKHSKVKVFADAFAIEQLENNGICTDHGIHKKGVFFISDFSIDELALIQNLGLTYEVLVDDVYAHYQKTKDDPAPAHLLQKGGPCGAGGPGAISYPTPTNFNLGSMGGFHTYSEILTHLDQMAALYPNLITVKAPISTFTTVDGNSIYYVKISDNPGVDESEPELMYTSLIHAREPLAGAQMIYYLWYLLENYATNPEVQYLVDNTEMYFVPVVNPDGYEYNEQLSPTGGGLWRKNRRDFGGGDFGVDLNRNFDYQWNTTGTSNNPGNNTYCGPNAFSEVETSAIKWFCENRDFKLAMNYHSYGSLLLFPFGHNPIQTPDYDYQAFSSGLMVEQNGYGNILSADLYPASGDSDDWMYAGDLGTKPKIFAFTPEVAGDDFWFPTSQIIPYSEGLVYQNLQAAWMVTRYAVVNDESAISFNTLNPVIDYEIQRAGLLDGGTYSVSIAPIGPEVISATAGSTFTLANPMDTDNGSITLTLDPSIQAGQEFSFLVHVDNGLFITTDTITKLYGPGSVIFADNGNTLANWTGNWGISTSNYLSATGSLHDSPGGDYDNNQFYTTTLSSPIDLVSASSATFSFWSQWEIEAGWDYAQIQASTNGSTWTPLCGNYTVTGGTNQDTGNPLWDGTQGTWVKEEINLDDYLGQTIQLRFVLVSDQAATGDGFFVDDMEILVLDPLSIAEQTIGNINLEQNMPNPAGEYTLINYELAPGADAPQLIIYDALGKIVKSLPLNATDRFIRLDTRDLSIGVYLYQIRTTGETSAALRLSVVR